MNEKTVPEIIRYATAYRDVIASQQNAIDLMTKQGFDFAQFEKWGFYQDKSGLWSQRVLGAQATDKEREDMIAGGQLGHNALVNFAASLRHTFGGSAEAAENILVKAGFNKNLFSNEPGTNDTTPFNSNGITSANDDGDAGGNYSGTGKLSSAAPKQIIVNISNLLSVETIDLMRSPEGQVSEVQNLKDQLAQALIDVVHDFDASWNG